MKASPLLGLCFRFLTVLFCSKKSCTRLIREMAINMPKLSYQLGGVLGTIVSLGMFVIETLGFSNILCQALKILKKN